MLIVSSVWSIRAMGQDPVMPISLDDMRYQFMAHSFLVGGVEQEIYVKLDTYTGQTWRFHASDPQWNSIGESQKDYPRDSSSLSRYEIHTHDYLDTNGDPQEVILRADVVTGHTWTYRGANGTWKEVAQDTVVNAAQ
jgi:hypothetical protein